MPPIALVFSAALAGLLAGCTMGGKETAPMTTGSVAPAVQVEGPLPQTLAYSDAAMIGAAASSGPQASGAGEFEWINAATGSSGTLTDLPTPAPVAQADPSRVCKVFNTIVTSFAGVHKYNGRLCSSSDGRRTVSIDAPTAGNAPAPAFPGAADAAAPVSVPMVRTPMMGAPAMGEAAPPPAFAAG